MPWNTITTQITGHTVTAAEWNDIGENMLYMEPIFYGEFTAPVNVTSNTSTAPDTIITSGAQTYENIPYWFEFQCPVVVGINGNVSYLQLVDGTTEISRIAGEARATNGLTYQTDLKVRYTPSAGSHTFLMAGYNSSAVTVTYTAGAGGTSTTNAPGHLHIYPAIP